MSRFRMTRDFYRPKDKYSTDLKKFTDDDLGLEWYTFTGGGDKPFAMGFSGKRSAPDFHHRYTSIERREQAINDWIDSIKSDKRWKAEHRAERKAYKHTLKVGDILYASWGYDQTNIDFYEVTEVVSDKSVRIRQLTQTIEQTGHDSGRTAACPGEFIENEKEMLKRVQKGNNIKIESYAYASLWSGKPLANSWGH